jgi:zinc/manganese transport system substrate-binding protein
VLNFREGAVVRRRTLLTVGLGLLAPAARAAATLPVVASFSILEDFTREIGGPRVSISTLVPLGTDMHQYQPRPSDVRNVTTAAVFVINGLGLEGWAERLSEAAGFKGKGIVATRGLQALPASHNHAMHGKTEQPHSHGAYDPHAWQDVANVRVYVTNIRDGLAAADPVLLQLCAADLIG